MIWQYVNYLLQCRKTAAKPSDNIDNDCDGKIDEERINGKDDDDDGLIDEDFIKVRLNKKEFDLPAFFFPICVVPSSSLVTFE